MNSNRQTFWCRSNRLLIDRWPAAKVRQQNEVFEREEIRLTRPQSYATPASKITDCFSVFDKEQEQCHMICVHKVDYRPRQTNVREVVKFSKICHAPYRSEKLRLATPSYYRDQESLPQGIADPNENKLRKNATHLMCNRFPNSDVEAYFGWSSFIEPWMYCAAHLPRYGVYRELKAKFSDEYNYDAATEIKDVDAFAMWLGIDYALQIDKGKYQNMDGLNPLISLAINISPNLWKLGDLQNIDSVVHVYHGPVHYEDEAGIIATNDDLVDIHIPERACFTKRTEFEDQSEYRFAISTPETPEDKELWLDVSEDLRELTSPMR